MLEGFGTSSCVVTLSYLLRSYFSCWADVVAEDVYITIYKTDGYDAALSLRNEVVEAPTRSAVSPASIV
jgi:hypothetical protein